jgi:hypothetical protein
MLGRWRKVRKWLVEDGKNQPAECKQIEKSNAYSQFCYALVTVKRASLLRFLTGMPGLEVFNILLFLFQQWPCGRLL